MRHFAAFVIAAVCFAFVTLPAVAQNTFPSNNAANVGGQTGTQTDDNFTFVLELNDDMIAALQRGEPLKAEIPLRLRNRVTEVRLRYTPPETPDRTAGLPPINRTAPGTGGTINSRLDPNLGNSRNDSNRFGGPPSRSVGDQSTLNDRFRGTSPINNGSRQPPPVFTPRNQGNGSNNSSMLSPRQNDGMVPTVPRRQYNQQAGPPIPNNINPNSYNQNRSTLPQYRGGQGTQVPNTRSGINDPASSNNYFPRNSSQNQMRPSAPAGSEYDTNGRNWNDPRVDQYAQQTQPRRNDPGLMAPQFNNGRQPQNIVANGYQTRSQNEMYNNGQYPAERFANRDYERGYNGQQTNYDIYHQPRRSLVVGQDMPIVPNHSPRIAARAEYQSGNEQLVENQDLTGRIPAPTDDKSVGVNRGANGAPVAQLTRFNSTLYFLLLCSIGLNLYLGWISRGFYVRYRELADELRDTFSTAV